MTHPGALGATCTTGSNCLYGLCKRNVCTAPLKSCPTAVPGMVCSYNGVCGYSDPSGSPLYNCTILDVNCYATCSCHPGYGGRDCSLTTSDLEARDALRYFFLNFFSTF